MDDPDLDSALHLRALRGLGSLNRLSMASHVLVGELRRLKRTLNRPVRVVDIAAGGGDVVIAAARTLAQPLEITLMDISPAAMEAAAANARAADVPVHTVTSDVRSRPLPRGDLLMCSLFLHHLSREDAVTVLRRMRDAADAVVLINDLRRCLWGRVLAGVVPQLVTRSRIVHVDAVRSARAAWTAQELRDLARHSGLHDAVITPRFPARMTLIWRRPGD